MRAVLLLLAATFAACEPPMSPCVLADTEESCLTPKGLCVWCAAESSCHLYFCGNPEVVCMDAVFDGTMNDCGQFRTSLIIAFSVIFGILALLICITLFKPLVMCCFPDNGYSQI